jgi:hypothetical protein
MSINIQNSTIRHVPKEGFFTRLIKGLFSAPKTESELSYACTEEEDLISNIRTAKKEWANAVANFDYVSEEEIIDYYTYKIKACQIRYEYYLKKAKEKGIRVGDLEIPAAEYRNLVP